MAICGHRGSPARVCLGNTGTAASGSAGTDVRIGAGADPALESQVLLLISGDAVHRSEWASAAGDAHVVIDYCPVPGTAGYEIRLAANMSAKPRQTTNLRFHRDIRGRGDRRRFARLIAD